MAASSTESKRVIYRTLKYDRTCNGVKPVDDAKDHPRVNHVNDREGFVYVFPHNSLHGAMRQLQEWISTDLVITFANIELDTEKMSKCKEFFVETRLAYYAKTFDLLKFDGKKTF